MATGFSAVARRAALLVVTSLVVFVLAGCTGGDASHDPTQGINRAVSLAVLQERLQTCRLAAGECPADVVRLGALTRLDGFVLDPGQHDIVLVGRVANGQPALYSEDLVVALRSAWLRYAERQGANSYLITPLGCSIDPDQAVIRRLQAITMEGANPAAIDAQVAQWRHVCSSPQSVRVLGVNPVDVRAAAIMVEADYNLKRVVDGTDDLGIPSLTSLSDMRLQQVKERLAEGGKSIEGWSFDRFWLHPGPNRVAVAEGVAVIAASPVVLSTEAQFLGRGGNVDGTGRGDPLAQAFAARFTHDYAEVAKTRPIFAELEALFRHMILSATLQELDAERVSGLRLDYLLDNLKLPATPVADKLPGRAAMQTLQLRRELPGAWEETTVRMPSCGGVTIDMRGENVAFIKAPRAPLDSLAQRTVAARPATPGRALYWDIAAAPASVP